MAVDRSIVGMASPPKTFTVEAEAIRLFAEAIGDPHPAYQAGEVAPPTFPTTFRVALPGVEVDPARLLHREEEYEYQRPLRAGDRVTVVRRVVEVTEKGAALGRMLYVISEVEGRDPHGQLIYRGRTALIVR